MKLSARLLGLVSVRPAPTMRAILAEAKRPAALPIVIAAVVSWSLREIDLEAAGEAAASLGSTTSVIIALVVLVVIVLVSVLFYFVVSAAAIAAGRWMLGGSGSFRDVRHAIAWGLAPQVWAFFLRASFIFIWPGAVAALTGERGGIRIGNVSLTPIVGNVHVPLYQIVLIGAAELAIFIWYLIVGSQTLAVAQGFSAWRGLGNLALALILPFVAVLMIVLAALLTIWTGS